MKLNHAHYTRALLLNANRMFARDPGWVIYNVGIVENKQVRQCSTVAARKNSKELKAEEIIRMMHSKNFGDLICFSRMFAPLRGYQPYWTSVRLQLKSFCKALGPPHVFFTLNPDVERWNELHMIYSAITKATVNSKNIRREIDFDCVPFVRFFHTKLKRMLDFLREAKPFGELVNIFYRIEYQSIGYNHAHGFIWLQSK